MPAVILVLILITAAIVNRAPSAPRRQIQTASPAVHAIQPARSSVTQPTSTQQSEKTVSEQPRPASPAIPQSRTQPPASENTKGFIVRMKVTQGGTLTVTIDGSTSQGYDLIVGDSIEWKADRSVTLELSNAGGVEIDLNGKQLKAFGQSGKPAVVTLDAEGIKQ